MDKEKIKEAIMELAQSIAFLEAKANTANDRIEGQFMRQVDMYIRHIREIIN